MEEERVVTRRNFKVKLPDEMMEVVMLLDGVMQRKEMYEHMRQHMMGLFSAHQGDEQTLLKSFCIERGKRELLVHISPPLERWLLRGDAALLGSGAPRWRRDARV